MYRSSCTLNNCLILIQNKILRVAKMTTNSIPLGTGLRLPITKNYAT